MENHWKDVKVMLAGKEIEVNSLVYENLINTPPNIDNAIDAYHEDKKILLIHEAITNDRELRSLSLLKVKISNASSRIIIMKDGNIEHSWADDKTKHQLQIIDEQILFRIEQIKNHYS